MLSATLNTSYEASIHMKKKVENMINCLEQPTTPSKKDPQQES